MHIPRQAERSGAACPAYAAATPAGAGAAAPLDGLRARRAHLVHQLRSVGYWQRLVRARTDLVVAGLLYSAPSPGSHAWAPLEASVAGPRAATDALDTKGLAEPPEGLDIGHLLDVSCHPGGGHAGPGERLDRLRAAAAVLAGRSRGLQEELDEVTAALHQGLASDGADEARPTGPVALTAPLPG